MECGFAVYVLNDSNDQWIPISYGDSEFECQLWVNEHIDSPYLYHRQYRIGVVLDSVRL